MLACVHNAVCAVCVVGVSVCCRLMQTGLKLGLNRCWQKLANTVYVGGRVYNYLVNFVSMHTYRLVLSTVDHYLSNRKGKPGIFYSVKSTF